MDAAAKTQRRRANRKTAGLSEIRIEMKDDQGNARRSTADLVDIIPGGLGLALVTPVQRGSIVIVRGKLGGNHTADHIKAVVRWCKGKADGTFRAGLEILDFRTVQADTPDLYEVMQLSPSADPDTISRVYRLLAMRYHPDNRQTGNSEMFLQLSEAYRVLSDPLQRAGYDARRRDARPLRSSSNSKVSDQSSASTGKTGGSFRPGALCGWDAALRAL